MTVSEPRVSNRRGCIALIVIAGLFVFLSIAVSLGWFGQVDHSKEAEMTVVQSNQL